MIELDLAELVDVVCHHERVLMAVAHLAREQGVDVGWCVAAADRAGVVRRSLKVALDACGPEVQILRVR